MQANFPFHPKRPVENRWSLNTTHTTNLVSLFSLLSSLQMGQFPYMFMGSESHYPKTLNQRKRKGYSRLQTVIKGKCKNNLRTIILSAVVAFLLSYNIQRRKSKRSKIN